MNVSFLGILEKVIERGSGPVEESVSAGKSC